MVSIALESLLTSPLNKTCSFVSDFTLAVFNTNTTIKVTQNEAKKFFKKIKCDGLLFCRNGINSKIHSQKKHSQQ